MGLLIINRSGGSYGLNTMEVQSTSRGSLTFTAAAQVDIFINDNGRWGLERAL